MASEPESPSALRVGETRLERLADCYAVLGPAPEAPTAAVVCVLGEGAATVLRGSPPPDLEPRAVPVYGRYAVPTGRVFARCAEGERIETRGAELGAAGYRIDEVPAYAPHAAWLTHVSGRIARALAELERLKAVPGIAQAEPELLRARADRTD